MAVCFETAALKIGGAGTPYAWVDSTSNGGSYPEVSPVLLLRPRVDQSLTNCAYVMLSGADYLARDPATNFADGMTLGWGVAAAMLAAWAIMHMRRGLGVGR